MASYRTVSVTATVIPGIVAAVARLNEKTVSADAKIVTELQISQYPDYEGETEFTPSAEAQTIHMTDMVVRTDIIINPIPSNWGRISWSGLGIRVS